MNIMSFRSHLRFHTALQLSLALESAEETLVGGQAVLEGVMMRAPHAWGIAIRKPDGELAIHSEPLAKPSDKSPWKAWPFIRGIITLGSAMVLGFKALRYSADVALEDEKTESGEKLEMNGWVAGFNIALSLGFFIFMYKFLPFAAARSLRHLAHQTTNSALFALVEGIIRLCIFLGFIWLTSRWSDIRRVYQYHGAEHKTVFAYENHEPLTAETVQRYSTLSSALRHQLSDDRDDHLDWRLRAGSGARILGGLCLAHHPVAGDRRGLLRDHSLRGQAALLAVCDDDRSRSLAATHHHPAARRYPSRVRHCRAEPCHGTGAAAGRRAGDRMMYSASISLRAWQLHL